MINILSYIGLNNQAEVCLWTILGILRTIFDATLFKVNANLKQVWHMKMPSELSMAVQHILRTIISSVILIQCFTLYIYLASYIVLLYPVFLEERPTLVLPWLLVAAIRQLLCELVSLTLGLGICVLLGPARSSCIKFVVKKLTTILLAFYLWMLIYSYYQALRLASAFKPLSGALTDKTDYLLELAIRRRKTKSLFGEKELRKNIMATVCTTNVTGAITTNSSPKSFNIFEASGVSDEDINSDQDISNLFPVGSNGIADASTAEDLPNNEIVTPRDTDRILEQFVLMLMGIGVYLKKGYNHDDIKNLLANKTTDSIIRKNKTSSICLDENDTTPPRIVSSAGTIASYLGEYPRIFQKKSSEIVQAQNVVDHSFIRINNDNSRHSTKSLPRQQSASFSKEDTDVQRKQESESAIVSKTATTNVIDSDLSLLNQIPVRYKDRVGNSHETGEVIQDNGEILSNKSIDSIIIRLTLRAARPDSSDELHIEPKESSSHTNMDKDK